MGGFLWDLQSTEEQNTKRLDLLTAKSYFGATSSDLIETLKGKNFSIGVGGLNFADTLLFRALDLHSIKLSEEDIEGNTMQTRLGMPVYSSMDPSKQVWSRFHHSDLPDPDSLAYRWTSYKSYLYNLWSTS